MTNYFKKIAVVISIFSLLVVGDSVSAMVDRVVVKNTRSGVDLIVPSHAVLVADHVFSLGESIDPQTGEVVEGYMIVHPKTEYAKPVDGGGKGGGKTGGNTTASTCFGFLAKGAKWKQLEPWFVNTNNPAGMSSASVFSVLNDGINKWEDAADGQIGDGNSIDILGTGYVMDHMTFVADETTPDSMNEVYFDDLDPGIIGLTIVWGKFDGKTNQRELHEWDQVYNTYYAWSDSGNSAAMDFANIATHELGHSVGLADLYDSACSEETMYGYGYAGETKKQTLEPGDIKGISTLY